jgi:hypothetical protein
MGTTKAKKTTGEKETKKQTPTFLLELPLVVDQAQARRLRAHLEAARQLYNALLGEALSRMLRMRADPRWQEARAIPARHKQERASAFAQLRKEYEFQVWLRPQDQICPPHPPQSFQPRGQGG